MIARARTKKNTEGDLSILLIFTMTGRIPVGMDVVPCAGRMQVTAFHQIAR